MSDEEREAASERAPKWIIPFGSAARGEMVEDGDLDLLLVADTRGGALDVTIATPAVVEANRHDSCCYLHDVLHEGRVFYS